MPGITRRSRIGIVDVNDFQDKEEIFWCPNCEEAGAAVLLGKRIYLPNEQGQVIVPEDADEWLQCPACGDYVPKREARGEGEIIIDPQFELIDTSFDFATTIMEPVREDRRIDRSDLQLRAKKKARKKQLASVDPDIKKEMIEGGEITSYEVIK